MATGPLTPDEEALFQRLFRTDPARLTRAERVTRQELGARRARFGLSRVAAENPPPTQTPPTTSTQPGPSRPAPKPTGPLSRDEEREFLRLFRTDPNQLSHGERIRRQELGRRWADEHLRTRGQETQPGKPGTRRRGVPPPPLQMQDPRAQPLIREIADLERQRASQGNLDPGQPDLLAQRIRELRAELERIRPASIPEAPRVDDIYAAYRLMLGRDPTPAEVRAQQSSTVERAGHHGRTGLTAFLDAIRNSPEYQAQQEKLRKLAQERAKRNDPIPGYDPKRQDIPGTVPLGFERGQKLRNDTQAISQRVPVPWHGPDVFVDAQTGVVYRVVHGGGLQITGHMTEWSKEEQRAVQILNKMGMLGGEKDLGFGWNVDEKTRRPLEVKPGASDWEILDQIRRQGQEIRYETRDVPESRRIVTPLLTTLGAILGTIVATPGYGTAVGAAVGSAAGNAAGQSLANPAGRVDPAQVAVAGAGAGLANFLGGYFNLGEFFSPIGTAVTEATGSAVVGTIAQTVVEGFAQGAIQQTINTVFQLVLGNEVDLEDVLLGIGLAGVTAGTVRGLTQSLAPSVAQSLQDVFGIPAADAQSWATSLLNLGIGQGARFGLQQAFSPDPDDAAQQAAEQQWAQFLRQPPPQGASPEQIAEFQQRQAEARARWQAQMQDWQRKYDAYLADYQTQLSDFETRLKEFAARQAQGLTQVESFINQPRPDFTSQLQAFLAARQSEFDQLRFQRAEDVLTRQQAWMFPPSQGFSGSPTDPFVPSQELTFGASNDPFPMSQAFTGDPSDPFSGFPAVARAGTGTLPGTPLAARRRSRTPTPYVGLSSLLLRG